MCLAVWPLACVCVRVACDPRGTPHRACVRVHPCAARAAWPRSAASRRPTDPLRVGRAPARHFRALRPRPVMRSCPPVHVHVHVSEYSSLACVSSMSSAKWPPSCGLAPSGVCTSGTRSAYLVVLVLRAPVRVRYCGVFAGQGDRCLRDGSQFTSSAGRVSAVSRHETALRSAIS